MFKKLSIWQWIIVSLIGLLIVQYIWNKREVANLREIANSSLVKEKGKLENKIDSVLIQYTDIVTETNLTLHKKDSIIKLRQQYLEQSIEKNRILTNKLLGYEKNLSYGNRTLNDALDVFANYKYSPNPTTKTKD